jgi:NADPH-dependent curcumin reductase CurA
VITSTSGADNIAFCKSMGADVVTDYKQVEIFSTLANNSVDVVYDNYGAKGTADLAMRVSSSDIVTTWLLDLWWLEYLLRRSSLGILL